MQTPKQQKAIIKLLKELDKAYRRIDFLVLENEKLKDELKTLKT